MPTVPATLPKAARGIAETIDGYIASELSIKETIITEQTPDQMGAVVDEEDYDVRHDLRAVLWGPDSPPAAAGDTTFSVNSIKYKVESVEKAGAYEQKVKWIVVGYRYTNFPAAAGD